MLSNLIKDGANALSKNETEKQNLVSQIFQFALGRRPTDSEDIMIKELVEDDKMLNSFEDVLWTLTMLPEFQLIN